MEFLLLGPLVVLDDEGGELLLGRRQLRALLSVLLLFAEEAVSRERLVDAVWSECPPPAVRTALQGHVSQLRKLVGAERLLTEGSGYRFRPREGEVDLARFERLQAEARGLGDPAARAERLRAALSLWRGRPLAEFESEPFARGEVSRLAELRLGALEERIEAELELGAGVELVPELESLVAAEPYRERLRGLLMLALYRSGRQVESLEVYRAGRVLLVDELGIDPSPELQRLERQILSQDATLETPHAGAPSRRALPQGTVTFVFTDVAGSTRLLRELGADQYAAALEAHRGKLREVFAAHDGVEVDSQGDSVFVAFGRASDALAAAAELTEALEGGPVRVGVHTGEPVATEHGYVGLDVHRAARIAAAGHGGQVLVSQTTRDLVTDAELRDLGEHRLKDLAGPERLWQLGAGEFPPLRSLNRTNLPLAAGPLLGREDELAQIRQLLTEGGVRLLTLTGPGGSGKTRLALQAAAELAEEFPDGVCFVPLAPLRESEAVPGAVAHALELPPDSDVRSVLASGRRLLVLDNAEHLDGVERVVSELLLGETRMLVTSRVLLHLRAEHLFPVEPLPQEAAAELFVLRAAAAGRTVLPDATVAALCGRLDNLPLAIELAAARSKLLSPQALFDRLKQALPLLTGGPRDAPERQQTLRATIEWSHDLLDETERRSLRRLAVFRGGIPLDAAVDVADADLDVFGSLVDKSLLKSIGDDRFLMLETVREYALEQLEAAGEAQELNLRHAHWYLERVAAIEPDSRAKAVMAWFLAEVDNLRAALATLQAAGDVDSALQLASTMWRAWRTGDHRRAGQALLERLLASGRGEPQSRGWATEALASVAVRLGQIDKAHDLYAEALALANEAGDHRLVSWGLGGLSWTARMKGSYQRALEYAAGARTSAIEAGDARAEAAAWRYEGVAAAESGDYRRAREVYERELQYRRSTGDEIRVADTMGNLALLSIVEGDPETAVWYLEQALEVVRGQSHAESLTLSALGQAVFAMAHTAAARDYFAQGLEVALAAGDREAIQLGLDGLATTLAKDNPGQAVELFSAAAAVRDAMGGIPPDPLFADLYAAGLAEARTGCVTGFDSAWTRGRTTPVDAIVLRAVHLARDLADGSASEAPPAS